MRAKGGGQGVPPLPRVISNDKNLRHEADGVKRKGDRKRVLRWSLKCDDQRNDSGRVNEIGDSLNRLVI